MSRYPFRIITYKAGVKVGDRAGRSRAAAEQFFKEAVQAAQQTASTQKVPRRVELVHGGVVIECADLPVTGATSISA
ncbi:MAG TPA: hypothetical protein VEA41_20045 [Salinarimonas sp.]|nr:hypothetical protein [Salinarimonas sp.]